MTPKILLLTYVDRSQGTPSTSEWITRVQNRLDQEKLAYAKPVLLPWRGFHVANTIPANF